MGFKYKLPVDLRQYGIPVTVEIDTVWRTVSLNFPQATRNDMWLTISGNCNGSDVAQREVHLSASSTPPIGDIMDLDLPEPVTCRKVSHVIKLLRKTLSRVVIASLPEFEDGEVVDP